MPFVVAGGAAGGDEPAGGEAPDDGGEEPAEGGDAGPAGGEAGDPEGEDAGELAVSLKLTTAGIIKIHLMQVDQVER